jgi:hypothetical protein
MKTSTWSGMSTSLKIKSLYIIRLNFWCLKDNVILFSLF